MLICPAMEHFADRLMAAIEARGNPVCVGLDPRTDWLPKTVLATAGGPGGGDGGTEADIRGPAAAILAFNRAIIDAVAPIVPVVKVQNAFYEEHGVEGTRAYARTIAYARSRGLIVIADVKRGDIGTTAESYARAHIAPADGTAAGGGDPGSFGADAVTVNPYLGRDSILPFVEVAAKRGGGVFCLVKTSNPSSADLQDLEIEGWPAFLRVADLLAGMGRPYRGRCGFSLLGAVVGATYPKQARMLRERLPDAIFLVPGYGAQGATASDAAACFLPGGRGAIVNSSRGILFAYKREPYASRFGEPRFAEAAAAAAKDMADELRRATGI
ncbi:MAG: orotidine-5'-phosphate decarboxylase [Planctomycetota bacterium]|nr:orotidine-5'-phosphate decarboxylase [Planctomycetota bacterium]